MEIIETLLTPGGKLRVSLLNQNKKESLLLIHGFMDNRHTFFRILPFLEKHFNIVSFDLRGHGDSSWNDSGMYHYAEILIDLQMLVEKYLPEPFSMIGHSFGASLAARYAGIFPWKVKSLVCLEGFSGRLSVEEERKKISSWLGSFSSTTRLENKTMASLETAEKILSSVYKKVPSTLHRRMAEYLTLKKRDGYSWKYDPGIKQTFPLPFPPELSRELWQNILSPVLVLFGSESELKATDMNEILSHFRSIRYVEIEGAGHNLHLEKPEDVVLALEKFYQFLIH